MEEVLMYKSCDKEDLLYFTASGLNFIECFRFSNEMEKREKLIQLGENLLKENIALAMSYTEGGKPRYKPTKDRLLHELRKMDKLIMPNRINRNDEFLRLRLKSFNIKRVFNEEVDLTAEIDVILTTWGLGIFCVSVWLEEGKNCDYIVNFARLILDRLSHQIEIQHDDSDEIIKDSLFRAVEKKKRFFKKIISNYTDFKPEKRSKSIDHICIECQSLSPTYHPDFHGNPLDLVEKYPKQIYGLLRLTDEWMGRGPLRLEKTLSHQWQSSEYQLLLYNDASTLRIDFELQDDLAREEAKMIASTKKDLGLDVDECFIDHKFVKRKIPSIRNIVLVELFLFRKALLYGIENHLDRFMTPTLNELVVIRHEIANALEIHSSLKTPLPDLKETIDIMEKVSRVSELKDEVLEKLNHLEDSIQTGHSLKQEKYTMFLSVAALSFSLVLAISQLIFPTLYPEVNQSIVNFIMAIMVLITVSISWFIIDKWSKKYW